MLSNNFTRFFVCFQIVTLFLGVAFSVSAQEILRPAPEIATGFQARKATASKDFMVVTANSHATRAAYEILEKGGSAADAAIAAQLVLGLVEPQSSGLGGGAFALYFDAAKDELIALDGRETAPFLSGPFLFYKGSEALPFEEAVLGGRSVGVPGTPMLLQDLHELYGRLTWMELFDEPIRLASEGFEVSPRLAGIIAAHQEKLARFLQTSSYFLDQESQPLEEGVVLKNTDYAETLRDYAFHGSGIFYRGRISKNIVKTVQNIQSNPGVLTDRDFSNYTVKKRKPVCGPYRVYIVCSMGEPSSGGLTLLQILGMVERFDLPGWGAQDARSWHVVAEASRLAFADRNLYMADPDFVETPGEALLDPVYIQVRSALIDVDSVLENVQPGQPPLWEGPLYEEGLNPNLPGTSHISVMDTEGNIVSMTMSIESAFGSHVMVDGFLLNNQLTDFSFVPFDKDGVLVANMVEPGKRPRSSMAPTIVFDQEGVPVLVLGSAGGSSIIGYVVQRIIAVLDWGIDVGEAMDMPNILARGDVLEMEEGSADLKEALENKGHKVEIKEKNSGLTAIHIMGDTFKGAADPRREGVALGQ